MEILIRQERAIVERNTGMITTASRLTVAMMGRGVTDTTDRTYVWNRCQDVKKLALTEESVEKRRIKLPPVIAVTLRSER
jgi:hypothetical protein